MKRNSLIVIGIALLVFVAVLFARMSFAEFKDAVKEGVAKEVITFYQAENGNKITEYSIRGLLQRIESVFTANEVPKPKPEPTMPTPPSDEK